MRVWHECRTFVLTCVSWTLIRIFKDKWWLWETNNDVEFKILTSAILPKRNRTVLWNRKLYFSIMQYSGARVAKFQVFKEFRCVTWKRGGGDACCHTCFEGHPEIYIVTYIGSSSLKQALKENSKFNAKWWIPEISLAGNDAAKWF